MSYIAPAGNAASVSWAGASAYTPPSGDAADATWASGLRSTIFGTPSVAPRAVGSQLTIFGLARVHPIQVGSSTTVVGIPYGVFHQKPQVTGFALTQFGEHYPARTQPASGSILTNYGTLYGVQHWDAATLGRITRYGAVFYAYTFNGQAQGFTRTNFGHPVAFRVAPGDIGINTNTYAVYSTEFGTPRVSLLLSGIATGLTPTQYGTHEARRAGTATGVFSTLLGTHRSVFKTYGVGIWPTAYGTPSSRRFVPATALLPRTRFGTPTTWRSDTYPAYGLNISGKFGQPRGFSRFNHPATGFFSSYVGVPSCRVRSRATHLPPGSAFGIPLLKRALTC